MLSYRFRWSIVLLAMITNHSTAAEPSFSISFDESAVASSARPIRENGITYGEGVRGKAANFNGKSYVDFRSNRSNVLGDDFAIRFWLKISKLSGDWMQPIKKWRRSRDYGFIVHRKSGKLIFSAGYDNGKPFQNFPTGTGVADGKWHFVAISHRGTEGKLNIFIDGAEALEADLPADRTDDSGAPIRIGEGLIGAIDELAIYNRAIDTEELLRPWKEMQTSSTASLATPSLRVGYADWSYKEKFPSDQLVDDFEKAIAEAKQRTQELEKKIDKLEQADLNLYAERTSLEICEYFIRQAEHDQRSTGSLMTSFLRWQNKDFSRAHAKESAELLPKIQAWQILRILDQIDSDLKNETWLAERPKPVGPVQSQKLKLEGRYLHQDGRPVLAYGFNGERAWREAKWGMQFANIPIPIDKLFPRRPTSDSAVIRQVAFDTRKALAVGLIPNYRFGFVPPRWLLKKYPDLCDKAGHFMDMDIDHPETRAIVEKAIRSVSPALPKDTFFTFKLGNEISFPLDVDTILGDDNRVTKKGLSPHGEAQFVEWLKKKYRQLDELNDKWATSFRSWQAAAHAKVDTNNGRQFFDACKFNDERVLAFYVWMNGTVKRYAPTAQTYLNLPNGKFLQGSYAGTTHLTGTQRTVSDYLSGVWVEGLHRSTDLAGFDTTAMRRPPFKHHHPKYRYEAYAFEWLGLAANYDFHRCVAPNKLMFENELHNAQTLANHDDRLPPEHMTCVNWMQYALGVGMNQLWSWSRSNYRPLGRATHCSVSNYPALVEAFIRSGIDASSVTDVLAALSNPSDRKVSLLYSQASAIQSVEYLDTQLASYEALAFLGVPIGFCTEQQLLGDGLSDQEVVIVAGARHVSQESVAALQKYQAAGGKVWLVGNEGLDLDEQGVKRKTEFTFDQSFSLDSVETLHRTLKNALRRAGFATKCIVEDDNGSSLGLFHRSVTIDGQDYLFVAQLCAETKNVRIQSESKSATGLDLISGNTEQLNDVELDPWAVRLYKMVIENP